MTHSCETYGFARYNRLIFRLIILYASHYQQFLAIARDFFISSSSCIQAAEPCLRGVTGVIPGGSGVGVRKLYLWHTLQAFIPPGTNSTSYHILGDYVQRWPLRPTIVLVGRLPSPKRPTYSSAIRRLDNVALRQTAREMDANLVLQQIYYSYRQPRLTPSTVINSLFTGALF